MMKLHFEPFALSVFMSADIAQFIFKENDFIKRRVLNLFDNKSSNTTLVNSKLMNNNYLN